jgi:hypothetical protein
VRVELDFCVSGGPLALDGRTVLTDCCALVAARVSVDLIFELFDNFFGVVDDFVGFLALGL